MTNAENAADRRQAPRFGCVGDAEIMVPGRGLRFPGRVVDLSAGGCFIETKCRLERGTMFEVWMNPEGQPLRLAANLVVQRPGGVGCRFHGVTERKLAQIRWLIRELEAEAQRAAEPEQPHDAADEAADPEEIQDLAVQRGPAVVTQLPAGRSGGWLRRILRRLPRERA